MNLSIVDALQSIKNAGICLLAGARSSLVYTFAIISVALFFVNITPASLTDYAALPEAVDSAAKYRSQPAKKTDYSRFHGELQAGDTLDDTLRQAQINAEDRHRIISALDELLDFRALRPRDRFMAVFDHNDAVVEYRYQTGPLDIYRVQRTTDDVFQAEKMNVALERKTKKISAEVESSLFAAFKTHGEKARLVYSFADIFSSRMDFNAEIRAGDRFQLIFEKYYQDGEFVGYGPIIHARYQQARGEAFEAFRFESSGNQAAYFDADGRELAANFLLSPVPMARVTSGFTRGRKHPILNEVRPHLAVDLAAPAGTPIKATADGRIIFREGNGDNGKLVVIEHSDGYFSYYAHLSSFEQGLKLDDRVLQGDIIGFVGSTGLATGPHVCYRIRRHGEYINPMKLSFKPRSVLKGEVLAHFREQVEDTSRLAKNLDRTDRQVMTSRITVTPDYRPTLL